MPVKTIEASGVETLSGQSAVFQVRDEQTWATFVMDVTAGSGTVTQFDAKLQVSLDGGTDFHDVPFHHVCKNGVNDKTNSGTQFLVEETAVQTASRYCGTVRLMARGLYRIRWEIAGTSPSETFEIRVNW